MGLTDPTAPATCTPMDLGDRTLTRPITHKICIFVGVDALILRVQIFWTPLEESSEKEESRKKLWNPLGS